MFEILHSVLRSLRAPRRPRPVARPNRLRRALTLESLEERTVLSTASSITAGFNGTVIPAGDTLWFSGSLQAGGLPPGTTSATIYVENGSISFTSGGTPYQVSVPNAIITLTSGATSASVSFDPTANDWNVSAPTGGAGNVFMGGAALYLPGGLPGGIKNVTWSANFESDTPNLNVQWHWGAAAYSSFSSDDTALNVKPVDNNNLSVYKNGDHAGAPEAYKTSLVAGGTGDGKPGNYTGNNSPNAQVTPSLLPPPGMTYLTGSSADYPFASSNPLTSVVFNESDVLAAAAMNTNNNTFDVWYTDEHALTLGVNQLNGTPYTVSAMNGNPGAVLSNLAVGAPNGVDPSNRPLAPSLYITDITTDTTSRIGDWQYGGTAIAPSAAFGAWKSATETITNGVVTISEANDPAQNGLNLGAGADAPPAGMAHEGYTAEVRWNLADLQSAGILLPGHNYRFYVMVHDGDQNKGGGDVGQASYNLISPIPVPPAPPASSSLAGYVYADNNANGVMDAGDSGLAGWTVILTGTDSLGNTVSLTTTTLADGSYSFSGLAAGTYQVAVQGSKFNPAPAATDVGTVGGLTDGTVGSNGSIGSITLKAGDKGINYDFAEAVIA
jgi:hypothetical protein